MNSVKAKNGFNIKHIGEVADGFTFLKQQLNWTFSLGEAICSDSQHNPQEIGSD